MKNKQILVEAEICFLFYVQTRVLEEIFAIRLCIGLGGKAFLPEKSFGQA